MTSQRTDFPKLLHVCAQRGCAKQTGAGRRSKRWSFGFFWSVASYKCAALPVRLINPNPRCLCRHQIKHQSAADETNTRQALILGRTDSHSRPSSRSLSSFLAFLSPLLHSSGSVCSFATPPSLHPRGVERVSDDGARLSLSLSPCLRLSVCISPPCIL